MTQKEELREILKAVLHKKFTQNSPSEIQRLSFAALANLLSVPVLRVAETTMLYIEMPHEFPVTPFFPPLLNHPSRRIIVPWCDGNCLRAFCLISPGEVKTPSDLNLLCAKRLSPGHYGILEPKEELRFRSDFQVEPDQIDLVIIPGLGFDRSCRRLGRGKGYYDRFITVLRRNVPLIGVCFDEQIVERVPTEPHDRTLDYVVTPTQIFAAESNASKFITSRSPDSFSSPIADRKP